MASRSFSLVVILGVFLFSNTEAQLTNCPSDDFYQYGQKCYVYFWNSGDEFTVDIVTAMTKFCTGFTGGEIFYAVTQQDYNDMMSSGVLDNKTVSAWVGWLYSKSDSKFIYSSNATIGANDFLQWKVGASNWAANQPNSSVSPYANQNTSGSTYVEDSKFACVFLQNKASGSGLEFNVASCNQRRRALCMAPVITTTTTTTTKAPGGGSNNSGSGSNNSGSNKNGAGTPKPLSLGFIAFAGIAGFAMKRYVP